MFQRVLQTTSIGATAEIGYGGPAEDGEIYGDRSPSNLSCQDYRSPFREHEVQPHVLEPRTMRAAPAISAVFSVFIPSAFSGQRGYEPRFLDMAPPI